ncbi:MAG: hypothetical protein KF901_14535 [Myxococcales bacterium]|nr:hypothetical protein [Myxococcales bacterium]
MLRALGIAAAAAAFVVGTTSTAHAVRPFVTDDARIIDYGQLELEMWPELVFRDGKWHPGFHVMSGVSPTEWLEIIVGGGIGLEEGRHFTVANPVIQPKLLVWRAAENGFPGLSLAAGVTLPVGRGEMFDDATGLFFIAPITSRLFDDWFLIHANVGLTAAIVPGDAELGTTRSTTVRPYWGVGIDVGLFHKDARFIFEAYAGDPFEALGPRRAFQWGFRWMRSDYVNLDVTFGAQPRVAEGTEAELRHPREFWGQIGIRLLFDVFRDGPGDPMGARGMTGFRRFHPELFRSE